MRDFPRVTEVFLSLARRLPFLVELAAGEPTQFPAARDFAYTTDAVRPIRIVFAPKLEMQTRARISGVLLHEFGHASLMRVGDAHHDEHAADREALRLFGRRVRYDAATVQTIDPRARYALRPVRIGK